MFHLCNACMIRNKVTQPTHLRPLRRRSPVFFNHTQLTPPHMYTSTNSPHSLQATRHSTAEQPSYHAHARQGGPSRPLAPRTRPTLCPPTQ
ncbi:hypothetical protein BC826DRAFT_996447 [Russula brevipes]|nr:hypothetical protein BC826DRAFT_996447 [Russula brevipes]